MPERFHILLLGDPGTGKTDVLRAAVELAPISSFGLGSGSSKVGLAGMMLGKETKPGLLAQAHNGLCALDELNLLKGEDRGALYNAMEKGFVSYDKGGVHKRFDADIRVLATANPTGDRWKQATVTAMRKQLPFDAALLSRFQLLFIIHKPSLAVFRQISRQVLAGGEKPFKPEDAAFIKAYLAHARSLQVTMPREHEETVVKALSAMKEREHELLIEVTPRLVKGARSLALAHARLALRTTASAEDVDAALTVITESLRVAPPDTQASAQAPKKRSKPARKVVTKQRRPVKTTSRPKRQTKK
jgi:replicative DNA helicase Mcm